MTVLKTYPCDLYPFAFAVRAAPAGGKLATADTSAAEPATAEPAAPRDILFIGEIKTKNNTASVNRIDFFINVL